MNDQTIRANPLAIQLFATRSKCLQCKHRFVQSYLLPVENQTPGKLQPNFNVESLFHMQDTHGIPNDTYREWITGVIYDQEIGDFGIRSNQPLAGIFMEEEKL